MQIESFINAAAAELIDDARVFAISALNAFPTETRKRLHDAMASGARLQLLLSPAERALALLMVGADGQILELGTTIAKPVTN